VIQVRYTRSVYARPSGQVTGFPARRVYLVLGLGFLAFAVYGSLIPFEVQGQSVEAAWHQFQMLMRSPLPRRISRSDLLANILLTVPAGFTLCGALLVDRRRRFGLLYAAVIILPVCVLVSLTAEFLQIFTSRRVPSNLDVAAQAAGYVAGIVAWGAVGSHLTSWVSGTIAAAPEDRLGRVLTAFVAGWLFVSLAPFDITVDVGDLARRLRSGKIALVPFAQFAEGLPARSIWDAIAEFVGTIPLGAAGVLAWRASRLMAFVYGAALVAGVELAQVFISSHAATTTDVLFGCAGVAAGAALSGSVPHPSHVSARSSSFPVSLRALALTALWGGLLCAYHWRPYDFAVDPELIRHKLGGISLIPFASYARGSYLNAFNNFLSKLALSAPLGLSLALVDRRMGRSPVVTVVGLVVAAGVFGTIELGQLFLATRVPDPSDVLVGVSAAYGGMRLARWLWP
jgi:VanZ family protein